MKTAQLPSPCCTSKLMPSPTVARAFLVDSTPHQNTDYDHPRHQEEVGRHAYHHHRFENPVYARTTAPAAVPSPPSIAKKPTQAG